MKKVNVIKTFWMVILKLSFDISCKIPDNVLVATSPHTQPLPFYSLRCLLLLQPPFSSWIPCTGFRIIVKLCKALSVFLSLYLFLGVLLLLFNLFISSFLAFSLLHLTLSLSSLFILLYYYLSFFHSTLTLFPECELLREK